MPATASTGDRLDSRTGRRFRIARRGLLVAGLAGGAWLIGSAFGSNAAHAAPLVTPPSVTAPAVSMPAVAVHVTVEAPPVRSAPTIVVVVPVAQTVVKTLAPTVTTVVTGPGRLVTVPVSARRVVGVTQVAVRRAANSTGTSLPVVRGRGALSSAPRVHLAGVGRTVPPVAVAATGGASSSNPAGVRADVASSPATAERVRIARSDGPIRQPHSPEPVPSPLPGVPPAPTSSPSPGSPADSAAILARGWTVRSPGSLTGASDRSPTRSGSYLDDPSFSPD